MVITYLRAGAQPAVVLHHHRDPDPIRRLNAGAGVGPVGRLGTMRETGFETEGEAIEAGAKFRSQKENTVTKGKSRDAT